MRGRARAPLTHVLRRAHRPRSFAPEAEVGPCWQNEAVQFVISGLRTNGLLKTGKSLRYNSRIGVRQPMPFRKHQVDCLRLWRLSSPWILKRILLAIFNIRAGAKRTWGLSQGCLAKGFRARAGRGDGWGPPCGRVLSSRTGQGGPFLVNITMRGCSRRAERVRHGRPRRRKATYRAPPIHPSRRMRNRPESANKKGRAQSIASRRYEASTCGKTIAPVPFRHLEPHDRSEARMRTHNTRATG